ncbi:HNH endonuclease [Nocardioides sambongensis]|uniref:HNH endonuclease n=1 Tax=Nocardioides sambongensis TaxID=2589074 RepID=UPI001126732C|nr:HNH endonuclease [Nocardioides sambongensis]
MSALLPVAQGVALHASLTRAANAARAVGDSRTKGQLMADTLVHRVIRAESERVEGSAVPDRGPRVPVGVTITIPVTTLAGGLDPAELHADGVPPEVLPAEMARHLIAAGLDDPASAAHCWFRRLFVDPGGRLIAMTTRSRDFPAGLAGFLAQRGGGICATPWCDAPVRHTDHIVPADDGGTTDARNGQGLCEACNHAKQAPGWHQRQRPDRAVETVTPTGHRYRSRAPAPPGWHEPRYLLTRPGVYTLTA